METLLRLTSSSGDFLIKTVDKSSKNKNTFKQILFLNNITFLMRFRDFYCLGPKMFMKK